MKTRPLPESQVQKFENELANYPWAEVMKNKSPDEQTHIFHSFLINTMDKYLPEKSTKICELHVQIQGRLNN